MTVEPTAEPAIDHEPPLVEFGDVIVSQSWVVTPAGTRRLREVRFTVTPMVTVRRVTPTWAIVVACLGAVFFLLGLLFLLVKEEKVTGSVNVTVEGPGLYHAAYIPIRSQFDVGQVVAKVDHARSLAINVG